GILPSGAGAGYVIPYGLGDRNSIFVAPGRHHGGTAGQAGMSILKIISARLDSMSEADREIGRFIVEHPERMLQLSSAALAAETARSQSSVVKFSQKMGYAGYQELKLAVNKAQ